MRIVNAIGESESEIRGAELLLRFQWQDIKFTGSYLYGLVLYTNATKQAESGFGRKPLALTPEHSAGVVIMWEEHGSHLLGFEVYYTGLKSLKIILTELAARPIGT